MQFSAVKRASEHLEEQVDNVRTLDSRALKRALLHFGIGAVAIVTAIASASPAFAGSVASPRASTAEEKTEADAASAAGEEAQTTAVTTAAEEDQPYYATETWWKAGIEEYDLVEYTAQQVDALDDQEELVFDNEGYPEISFEVVSADGKSAAEPIIYPHVTVGTRDISKEYYTVKSVDNGSIISGEAFDLVCRILNAEMGAGYPMEALKAQAVAIYSYLRYCDAHGAVPIVGVSSSYGSRIEQAVRAVEGQICTYNGSPINALFCASTAGNSIGSEYVWGRALPYLKPVVGKYDTIDPNYGVKKSFTAAQIKALVEKNTDIVLDPNDVENWFEITSRSYGKYVSRITIGGRSSCKIDGKTKTLTAAVFRSSIMGNNRLRSTAFDISYSNGVFTFTTYGYGHGVGMSQRGAKYLASKDGLKYDQILKYYYTGIAVQCSSANKKAEDRYGKIQDISGLEEASPTDDIFIADDDEFASEDITDITDDEISDAIEANEGDVIENDGESPDVSDVTADNTSDRADEADTDADVPPLTDDNMTTTDAGIQQAADDAVQNDVTTTEVAVTTTVPDETQPPEPVVLAVTDAESVVATYSE